MRSSTAAAGSTTRAGWRSRATSSSSPSTTGSARSGFLAHPALGPAGRRRQLRVGRPAGGAALGARQHRQLRRRSRQGHGRRRIGRRHVGVRPPRRAGLGGVVPGGDHPERAVPGASRHCPTAEKRSLDYAAEAGCGDPATAAQMPASICRRTNCENRCRTTTSARTQLTRAGDRDRRRCPSTRSAGFADGPRRPGAGADRAPTATSSRLFVAMQYLRLGESYTTEQYPQLLRETFGANAAAVGAALSAGALRRQCATCIFGGGHRWGVRLCGRSDGRRPGEDRARVRLRVQRPRRAGAGADAHVAVPDRRQPFARAAIPVRHRRCAAAESRRNRRCPTR